MRNLWFVTQGEKRRSYKDRQKIPKLDDVMMLSLIITELLSYSL